jgi:hypothetical protein
MSMAEKPYGTGDCAPRAILQNRFANRNATRRNPQIPTRRTHAPKILAAQGICAHRIPRPAARPPARGCPVSGRSAMPAPPPNGHRGRGQKGSGLGLPALGCGIRETA